MSLSDLLRQSNLIIVNKDSIVNNENQRPREKENDDTDLFELCFTVAFLVLVLRLDSKSCTSAGLMFSTGSQEFSEER